MRYGYYWHSWYCLFIINVSNTWIYINTQLWGNSLDECKTSNLLNPNNCSLSAPRDVTTTNASNPNWSELKPVDAPKPLQCETIARLDGLRTVKKLRWRRWESLKLYAVRFSMLVQDMSTWATSVKVLMAWCGKEYSMIFNTVETLWVTYNIHSISFRVKPRPRALLLRMLRVCKCSRISTTRTIWYTFTKWIHKQHNDAVFKNFRSTKLCLGQCDELFAY